MVQHDIFTYDEDHREATKYLVGDNKRSLTIWSGEYREEVSPDVGLVPRCSSVNDLGLCLNMVVEAHRQHKAAHIERRIIMAESFFTIIDRGTFEVNHKGEDVWLELPEDLKKLSGKLEDQKAIEEWLYEQDNLLAVVHSAVQKRLIELRALARPGEDKSIVAEKAAAQKRVSEAKWTAAKRPGAASKKALSEDELIKQLKALGKTPEELLALIGQK